MTNNTQARRIEEARRPNGEFGTQLLPEADQVVSLNDVTMPGLADDQTAEWVRLDKKVVAAGYASDALNGAELARYEFYSDLVDEAVRNGAHDWMPSCPVHSRGADGYTADGWGQDFSCPVCMDPATGQARSVNRLGIAEAIQQKWARDSFDAHNDNYAYAADFFGARAERDPSQYTFVDVELKTAQG